MLFNYASKKPYTIDIDEFAKSFDDDLMNHSQDKDLCKYIETSKNSLIKKYNEMNMLSFNSKYVNTSKYIYQFSYHFNSFDLYLHFDVPPISNLNQSIKNIPLSYFGDIIFYNHTDSYNREWADNKSPIVIGFLPQQNHPMAVIDGNHRITSKIRFGNVSNVDAIFLSPENTAKMLFDDFEKELYKYFITVPKMANPLIYNTILSLF